MVITNAYISSVRLRQGNKWEKSNRNIFGNLKDTTRDIHVKHHRSERKNERSLAILNAVQ